MAHRESEPTSASRKTGRLNLRVEPTLKSLLERAAAAEGTTVSEFCSRSIRNAARETLREAQQLRLEGADARAFFDALLHSPEPNSALRDAARAHAAQVVGES